MAEKRTARKSTQASAGKFSDEEKAAMKERARELKAEARADRDREAGERDLLAKIAEMPKADRAMATRLHEIVTASAPELMPKTWYGMPAYAKEGKVVCYFTPASKFKERYSTFGFNASAGLDDGNMWPTSFALTKLSAAEEKRIAALVTKAVKKAVSSGRG
jgi:uncharacterized protein YdhG (YjbR/CyaY superfamily)